MTPERLGLLWGVTVFAGAGARLLAAVSGLPGVVLLLLSGLLIGRSGLGLVEPLDLGPGLGTVVGLLVSLVATVAVVFVLVIHLMAAQTLSRRPARPPPLTPARP